MQHKPIPRHESATPRRRAEPQRSRALRPPLGELVKLTTVIHDGFEPGSVVALMVSEGWPRILSDLKTLLETGETLPANQEPPISVQLGLTTRQERQAESR
jgi:hypothetical protein